MAEQQLTSADRMERLQRYGLYLIYDHLNRWMVERRTRDNRLLGYLNQDGDATDGGYTYYDGPYTVESRLAALDKLERVLPPPAHSFSLEELTAMGFSLNWHSPTACEALYTQGCGQWTLTPDGDWKARTGDVMTCYTTLGHTPQLVAAKVCARITASLPRLPHGAGEAVLKGCHVQLIEANTAEYPSRGWRITYQKPDSSQLLVLTEEGYWLKGHPRGTLLAIGHGRRDKPSRMAAVARAVVCLPKLPEAIATVLDPEPAEMTQQAKRWGLWMRGILVYARGRDIYAMRTRPDASVSWLRPVDQASLAADSQGWDMVMGSLRQNCDVTKDLDGVLSYVWALCKHLEVLQPPQTARAQPQGSRDHPRSPCGHPRSPGQQMLDEAVGREKNTATDAPSDNPGAGLPLTAELREAKVAGLLEAAAAADNEARDYCLRALAQLREHGEDPELSRLRAIEQAAQKVAQGFGTLDFEILVRLREALAAKSPSQGQ